MIVPVVPMELTRWVTVPCSLLPNLWPGPDEVGARIVRITKLIQHLTLALRLHFEGQVPRPLHTLCLRHFHQLRTVSRHCLFPLQAHMGRHNQDQAVAAYRSGHRQGNSGIAAGGLDKRIARLDITALFRLRNHTQCGAILDRTGGVIPFQFGEDGIAGIARQTLQAHQWRIANTSFNSGILWHR